MIAIEVWPSISETIFGCAPTKQDRRGGAAEVANPLEARLLEDAAVIDVRELGRTERTRLETLADGAELDPGSAREMHVPVRVHRGRGAMDVERLERVRREVADRVDRRVQVSLCDR